MRMRPMLVVQRGRLAATLALSAIAAITRAKSAFRATSARADLRGPRERARTTRVVIRAISELGSKTAAIRAVCRPPDVAATTTAVLAAAVQRGPVGRSLLANPIAAQGHRMSAMANSAVSPSPIWEVAADRPIKSARKAAVFKVGAVRGLVCKDVERMAPAIARLEPTFKMEAAAPPMALRARQMLTASVTTAPNGLLILTWMGSARLRTAPSHS